MGKLSRGFWFWLLLGAIIGALAGFGWGKVCGEEKCPETSNALLGALLGLGVGIVAAFLAERRGSLRLSKAKLTLPGLGELEFEASDAQRQAGWRIFVEIATRIATQPLPADHGLIGETLDSLHKLFDVIRAELKSMPPSSPTENHTVEFLATRMLNTAIRPFLAEWHRRLEDWKADKTHTDTEADWPEANTCREQLENMRVELNKYALELGKLVEVSNAGRILEGGADG